MGAPMETRLTFSATKAPNRKRRHYRYSPVIKHSINLAGHQTSITLENKFWDGLREIARKENISIATLIERIDTDRIGSNLSSSARLFVLNYFKALQPSNRPEPAHLPRGE